MEKSPLVLKDDLQGVDERRGGRRSITAAGGEFERQRFRRADAVELPDKSTPRAAGLAYDVEALEYDLLLELHVEDALPGLRGVEFGEVQPHGVRTRADGHGVPEVHAGEYSTRARRHAPPPRHVVPSGSPEILSKFLSEVEFSGRSRKCLQRLGLVTMSDLVMKTEPELLATKNFGQTSLNEVKQKLAEFGLSFRK